MPFEPSACLIVSRPSRMARSAVRSLTANGKSGAFPDAAVQPGRRHRTGTFGLVVRWDERRSAAAPGRFPLESAPGRRTTERFPAAGGGGSSPRASGPPARRPIDDVTGGRIEGTLELELLEEVSPCGALEVQAAVLAGLDPQRDVAENRHAAIVRCRRSDPQGVARGLTLRLLIRGSLQLGRPRRYWQHDPAIAIARVARPDDPNVPNWSSLTGGLEVDGELAWSGRPRDRRRRSARPCRCE